MADPVNFAGYLGQAQQLVPNFQEALLREQLGGLQAQQIGLQNQQIAADTRLTEAKMQQAAFAQQQQATFSAEAEGVIRSGDPRQIAGLIARYPQYGDEIKGAWDRMDSRIQSSDLRDMGQIYSAANGGRFDLASAAMRRRIEADKAADGQADPQDEEILKLLESPDPADQKRGAGMVGFSLAAVTGPDKFASTYGALAEGEAGFTLSPGARRFDKDGNIIAEAPFAPRPISVGQGETIIEYNPNTRGGGPASNGGGNGITGAQIEQTALGVVPGVVVTSRQRSADKNRGVGGQPNSFHLTDQARDFVPPANMPMGVLATRLRKAMPGFDVINEGDHVHVEPSGSRGSAGPNVIARGAPKPADTPKPRSGVLKPGTQMNGYVFKGGNPRDKSNWRKAS